MRKTHKGRHVQHIVGVHKDTEMIYVRGPKIGETFMIKARKGRAIRHEPQKASPALTAAPNAQWVHWKDTDGARRRGWSNFRRL